MSADWVILPRQATVKMMGAALLNEGDWEALIAVAPPVPDEAVQQLARAFLRRKDEEGGWVFRDPTGAPPSFHRSPTLVDIRRRSGAEAYGVRAKDWWWGAHPAGGDPIVAYRPALAKPDAPAASRQGDEG